MNGGRITLTACEQRRLIVLNHLESGALVNAEAARLLGLSVPHLQRMKAAYADTGSRVAKSSSATPQLNHPEPCVPPS